MPIAIRDRKTGKYLGRPKVLGREWIEDLQQADLWSNRGPGVNAARASFKEHRWQRNPDIPSDRFESVVVTLVPKED